MKPAILLALTFKQLSTDSCLTVGPDLVKFHHLGTIVTTMPFVQLLDMGPDTVAYFLNGQSPASISFIFSLFKQISLNFLQQINVKKCPFIIEC